jgi:tetratricopeptide (TPR) repeat protein
VFGYAYGNRAFTYFGMGEYEKALIDFNKSVEYIETVTQIKKLEIYSNRGDLHIKLGNYNLAIDDYNSALRIDQNYSKATDGLSIALARKDSGEIVSPDTLKKQLTPTPNIPVAGIGLRYALIIGNAEYSEFNKLTNTSNDARDIASALEKAGFIVNLLLNADRRQMQESIIQFRDNLSKNPQKTEGFIWYAGHGIQHLGENYLIPLNSGIRHVDYLETDAIPFTFLMNNLKRAGNKTNIVVLDACRNNPLAGSRGGSRGLTVVGYEAIPQSTLILYSTAANEEASDGATGERNSPFARAFLNNINASTEFELTFKAIVRDTLQFTNNRQAPTRYGLIYDDFYLKR